MTTTTHDHRAAQDHGEPTEAQGQPGESMPIRTTIKKRKEVEPDCNCSRCIRAKGLFMEYGVFSSVYG